LKLTSSKHWNNSAHALELVFDVTDGVFGCRIDKKKSTEFCDFENFRQVGIQVSQVDSPTLFCSTLSNTKQCREAATADESKSIAFDDDVHVARLNVVANTIKKVLPIGFRQIALNANNDRRVGHWFGDEVNHVVFLFGFARFLTSRYLDAMCSQLLTKNFSLSSPVFLGLSA
jgi:hypothetical protein